MREAHRPAFFVDFLHAHWTTGVILCLLIVGAFARTFIYGDVRLSVGNAETGSYIASSTAPVFSWQSFAGTRLFTTNLIFKLANDPIACPLTAVSNPAEGHEVSPTLQPCFDRIALLQNLLSILGWCFFAWATSRLLRHPAAKLGVVVLLLIFGFTPQIAEWDSILSPESLSISLFVISLALVEEIIFQVAYLGRRLDSPRSILLVSAWLIVLTLWVFVRDVHLYAVLITILVVVAILFLGDFGQRKVLAISAAILLAVFLLGYYSARDSRRATRYALVHAFESYIQPYPSRVAFFARLGMPSPSSQAYQPWLDDNATRTYAMFLVSHPRFVVTTLWDNLYGFRASFQQQYYRGLGTKDRDVLLGIGEMLHPESNAVYLVDLLLFATLCLATLGRAGARIYAWTGLVGWFVGCTSIVLMASFFGDTEGYRRHMYPSIESFRLLMWPVLCVFFDEVLTGSGTRKPAPTLRMDAANPQLPTSVQPQGG